MLAALKRGDRVITGGGIVGIVQKVKEGNEDRGVEIAPNVRVTVVRETITNVANPTPANDTKAGERRRKSKGQRQRGAAPRTPPRA